MVKSTTVNIEPIKTQTVSVTLQAEGGSSLICHRFGESQKKSIRDKQSKQGKQAKAARDPEAEFKESLYVMPSKNGGPKKYGFPAPGIKKAIVQACSFSEGVTKTLIKGALHIPADLLEINGDGPHMREDVVRLGGIGNSADLRYRGEFFNWEIYVPIIFNSNAISMEQIANLINLAGFHVGIGDWRPGAPKGPGPHGMFKVKA